MREQSRSPIAIGPRHRSVSTSARPGQFLHQCGDYGVRFASSEYDLLEICRLRFLVFNLELHCGLENAHEDGYDLDRFDRVCRHLLVEHLPSAQVVGTYRLQRGETAAQSGLGYYSATEFDFSPYEPLRGSLIELGRAAVHKEHRSFAVINLLWRAIASYAATVDARYLIGCSSIHSQFPDEGWDLYWSLSDALVKSELRTAPRPECECPFRPRRPLAAKPRPPRLLLAYLSLGARICGPPAVDREFKTIDFLTLLDLQELDPRCKDRMLR